MCMSENVALGLGVCIFLLLAWMYSNRKGEMYRDGPYWGLPPNYPGHTPYASADWGIPGQSPGGLDII